MPVPHVSLQAIAVLFSDLLFTKSHFEPYCKVILLFSKGIIMKKDIHPEVFEVVAHCACGNDLPTSSTKKELRSTLCSKCHPFFTNQEKFVDAAGRIDKFNKKYKK